MSYTHLKATEHAPAMDNATGSRDRTLLTTARALQQECRMLHCDIMPRCDKMPQLHRFSWTAIEYSIVHSEVRRISSESRRGSRMRLKAPPADLWPGACQTAGP